MGYGSSGIYHGPGALLQSIRLLYEKKASSAYGTCAGSYIIYSNYGAFKVLIENPVMMVV